MIGYRLAACALALVSAAHASPVLAATPSQLAEAQRYVETIYKRLPGSFDYRTVRYAPTLKALIARDDACARKAGGICAIDSVPFCDCQDTSADYRLLRSAVMAKGRSGARVMVEMRNFGKVRYAVDLVLSNDKWFVSDITTPSTPSLVARLQRDLK
ncbi:hypothetical protein C7451_108161 [Blastomonas natatoria]|uniref:DUF3828 domain-containing protein n=1 Tax=Blastomonas natatoria TaxID=34015 RepID=A0A2V3VCR1_9SPHN|nr:hypothetical protein [Blastomonas natatoria]PXW74499.1 hypothetical protein C7451_108161 [Blastomonas natatoria]